MAEHLLGPFLRRFLLEELRGERNLSVETQRSYRDTFRLLLRFLKTEYRLDPGTMTVEDVHADRVRSFLSYIVGTRRCSEATRNQRLAALRSLFRFIAEQEPALVSHAATVTQIRLRRVALPSVDYLEKQEIDALIAAPDPRTLLGRRDHALLLFLYNTGARASEAAGVTTGALALDHPPAVRLLGKGRKERLCPIWPDTARVLRELIAETQPVPSPTSRVFVNVRGEPLTRFGIHALVVRHVRQVEGIQAGLREKRVSPHTIRHTMAVHLLRAGVDVNTIRGWLGHVSVDTTNRYAEIDTETKARALETCAMSVGKRRKRGTPRWKKERDLLEFLTTL